MRTCRCTPPQTCVKYLPILWVPNHTQNLNVIRPAVCEIWKTGAHARTCRFTPPLTCVKVIARWSLSTHQIWTQSGQPSWSYRWRGCLRHPLHGTCHVPWQAPAGIGTGQIHDCLDGDIVLTLTSGGGGVDATPHKFFWLQTPNRLEYHAEIFYSLWGVLCATFGEKIWSGQVRSRSYDVTKGTTFGRISAKSWVNAIWRGAIDLNGDSWCD